MTTIAFWIDPHIGKFKKLLDDEKSLRLSRRLLSFQLRETRKIQATHAVIMGDLFDGPFPSQHEMGLVIDTLSEAKDIKFIAMLGNHDRYDSTTNSFNLLSKLPRAGALTNVKFITKEKRLHWAGLDLVVLPYGSRPKEAIQADLCVFHDAVVGAKKHSGPNIGIGQGIHPSKFKDTIAVGGDIHLKQRVGDSIFYPGTIAPMTFGEESDKFYFGYFDNKYHSYEIEPPWNLKSVVWNEENPPSCNEANVYYRLLIKETRPPARWMVDHPQVVKIDGGSKQKQQENKNKVVSILQGKFNTASEVTILNKWLKTFTPLDKLSRMQGIKIHESFRK